METTVSVLFYIKRSKANNQGACPIYLRVTINSQRFEFSTKKFITPEKWSNDTAKAKGTTDEARTINNHLDKLKAKVVDAEKRFEFRF
jgi:hypothetical protein